MGLDAAARRAWRCSRRSLLAAWFGLRERLGRVGFYLLFALAVTASVQLVGVYLVFASLIVPALAVRGLRAAWRLPLAYLIGALGYLLGLDLSARFDLPSGARRGAGHGGHRAARAALRRTDSCDVPRPRRSREETVASRAEVAPRSAAVS